LSKVGDLVREAIARLRLKLVDLTNRNRLLNFKFSETSRKSIRVVDELPDALFSRLTQDAPITGRLYFASLPEPPVDTRSTTSALSAIEQSQEPTDASPNENAAPTPAKRAWGRSRGATARIQVDAVDWATQNGIDPSYELPKPAAGETPARHRDNEIQTMLFPDALEKKLSGIREDANLAWQESGIKTLYVAFGFLEWFETADSELPRYSPLFLLPVDIDRDLRANRYRYFIETAEEAEPSVNVSLQERLKREFGLALPQLQENETPESYLAQVERMIASQKRWMVRRFVVVGHFSFARLVMYQDLAPEQWNQLEENPLISNLLAGTQEGEASYASDFEVDEEAVEKHVPLLITDADSSQFSAIVDAMQGRSFALKGPPGTGKSQTITNLIAAALAAGKTVLFVAEKQAALQVVSKRLAAVGLAPFLLELHSTKSQKKALLDGFEERLKFRRRAADGRLEKCMAALRQTRKHLKMYVDLLNKAVGESGLTLHHWYWRDQRLRHQLTAAELKLANGLQLPAAESITPHIHDDHKLLLERYVSALSATMSSFGRIDRHPWYGLSAPGIGITAYEDTHSKLAQWERALSRLEKAVARSKELFGGELPQTVEPLTRVCLALASLPNVGAEVDADILPLLLKDGGLEQFEEFIAATKLIVSRREEIGEVFSDLDKTLSQQDALKPFEASFGTAVERCGLAKASLSTAFLLVAQKEREVSQSASTLAILTRFASESGMDTSAMPGWEFELVGVCRFIKGVSPEVIAARSQALFASDARVWLSHASKEAITLQTASRGMLESLSLSFQESPAEVQGAASSLRDTPFFLRAISGKYRASRSLCRRISKDRWLGASREADRLAAAAELLRKRQAFEQHPTLKYFAGNTAAGIDTPFHTLLKVVDYWEAVRKGWASLDPSKAPIQKVLLETPSNLLSDLASSVGDAELSRAEILAEHATTGETLASAIGRVKANLSEIRLAGGVLQKSGARESVPFSTIARVIPSLGEFGKALKRRALSPYASIATSQAVDTHSSVASLESSLAIARHVLQAPLPPEFKARLLSSKAVSAFEAAKRYGQLIVDGIRASKKPRDELVSERGLNLVTWFNGREMEQISIAEQGERAQLALSVSEEAANDWSTLCALEQELRESGMSTVAQAAREGKVRAEVATAFLELIYARSLIKGVVEEVPHLPSWNGAHVESLRKRLVQLDIEYLGVGHDTVVGTLSLTEVPAGVSQGAISAKTERALIEHEIGKQRRHISIRELMRRAPNATRALKPCFMMSPASVAQFIPQGQNAFDIVIIDEASQMRPEDALGALARGKQAIIVGDPMQLPPTTFFDSSVEEEERSEDEEIDIDTESVLDMGISSYRPFRELRWHYRSRHHSLIAFSNREFYKDNLIVFPSPKDQAKDLGVQTVLVENGIYRSSLNLVEADVVLNTVAELMRRYPKCSIGVVAINQPQKEHLSEGFDRLFAEDPDLEEYRARWAPTLESFFVKNLENVQGDERDIIVISTVYGRAAPEAPVMQRFGPINSKTGHRRLNVLFTRAKERVVLVTSLRPENITLQPGSSRGLIAFKNYLEYARSGRLDVGVPTGGSYESPFEEEVADVLEQLGYKVEPQVGVAGYFIDLGVRHTQNHEHFILGIECDGASYHSAKSARDRDRLRQSVLEGLGWKLYRIWSTDWFYAREREIKKLSEHMRLIEASHSVA
jgi:very-short-patch-repair endonuclease